jgi:hypothetical protein
MRRYRQRGNHPGLRAVAGVWGRTPPVGYQERGTIVTSIDTEDVRAACVSVLR